VLKRLFSIPSNTQAILALRDKPDVHPESYEMQLYYTKLMKVMKEGIYIGQNTIPIFFWVIMFILKSSVYDDNGNPMEGFETGRPLYSTIDRYILICFGKV
jgi:hypothetical protein